MKIIELYGVYKRYDKKDSPLGKHDFFWALSDVSFSINRGEAVGVIGPNGAGKSTLMKLISGISFPTKGRLSVIGKVVPLISIGGALHHVLTARENVILLSAAFGVRRNERRKIIDEIVKFSGISDYMDMQITKLSYGMHSRLSFSIAAHVPSDILLIDEVLAVGDQEFQQQCFRKIEQFKKDGKTIIFISHDLESVKKVCNKVIWLEKGSVIKYGNPEDVIAGYCNSVTFKKS